MFSTWEDKFENDYRNANDAHKMPIKRSKRAQKRPQLDHNGALRLEFVFWDSHSFIFLVCSYLHSKKPFVVLTKVAYKPPKVLIDFQATKVLLI
jgi:hypothetical protein